MLPQPVSCWWRVALEALTHIKRMERNTLL
jgi:hypothetical protein